MLALLIVVSSAQTLGPAHLKPGALVGHLGRVALVEDVLWVKYPYKNLESIPGRLQEVVAHLGSVLEELENEMWYNSSSDPDLLTLFK